MSDMVTSDVAEVRASADRLREYAGLIGDEETAGKFLRLVDDLDEWASRLERTAEADGSPPISAPVPHEHLTLVGED